MQIHSLRLVHQQLAQPAYTNPVEVVRWMGAVQAQDLPGSKWAIGCRMQPAVEAGIEQAIADRSILRTWPMRGTIHLVPAEDARWMVNLMAPRAIRRFQIYHRNAGLDEGVFARSREIFIEE